MKPNNQARDISTQFVGQDTNLALTPCLTDLDRMLLYANFGIKPDDPVALNPRGMVNQTFEINTDMFVTVYEARAKRELEAVAEIANDFPVGIPLVRPIRGINGYSVNLEAGGALVAKKLPGIHYVDLEHTKKIAIPAGLQRVLSSFFWEFQAQLSSERDDLKHELPGPSRATIGVVPEVLPEEAKILERFAPSVPLAELVYPDLVHDDLERQNILSVDNELTGVVDLDSIRQGDILYEFSHYMYNMVFCDPESKFSTASMYIDELQKAGIIASEDISSIYSLMYKFAISDIADFLDLKQDLTSDKHHRIDLNLLAKQYERALDFAGSFFGV